MDSFIRKRDKKKCEELLETTKEPTPFEIEIVFTGGSSVSSPIKKHEDMLNSE